jgi:hypothetical protein
MQPKERCAWSTRDFGGVAWYLRRLPTRHHHANPPIRALSIKETDSSTFANSSTRYRPRVRYHSRSGELDSWRSDTPDAPGTFGIHRTPKPDRQAGPFRLTLTYGLKASRRPDTRCLGPERPEHRRRSFLHCSSIPSWEDL